MCIYIIFESIRITVTDKKKEFLHRDPLKVHKAKRDSGIGHDLSDMVCVCMLHLPDLLALSAALHSFYKWHQMAICS